MSTTVGRLVAALLLLPGGAAVGAASVLVHHTLWGFPLALLSTILAVRALPGGLPRVAFALGWTASVGLFAVPRPAGGYLVAADLAGYTVLLFAFALVVASLATLPPRGAPRRASDRADESRVPTLPTMSP